MMSSHKPKIPMPPSVVDDAAAADERDLIAELQDPHTHNFLKSYLAITDEQLKAHLRRLVEETRLKDDLDSKKR